MNNPSDPDDLEGPAPSPEARAANRRAIAELSPQNRFHLMFTGKTEQSNEKADMDQPLEYIREVMQAFENGERIECFRRNALNPAWTLNYHPTWDWENINYRILSKDSNHSSLSSSPTDLDLQLFLTKQLPEEIKYYSRSHFYWLPVEPPNENLNVTWTFVNPREWDYIVRRVEEKLTISQGVAYVQDLKSSMNKQFEFDKKITLYLSASWQTRAIALKKLLS